jgi:hypothetical protein
VVADLHHFDADQDRDPDPRQGEKSRIGIRIKMKRGIRLRIRIEVMQIRSTDYFVSFRKSGFKSVSSFRIQARWNV